MASTGKVSPSNANEHVRVLQVMGNAIAGGMENYVIRLIERLPRERFLTTVLCPFESPCTEQLRKLDVEVIVTPMPVDTVPWCSVQTASTLIRTRGIDVVHAHMPNAHMLAGVAASMTGTPVISTIHARQMSIQDLEIHRGAGSHLIVVCKQTYFHALGLGVNAAQLTCIPNGVDTRHFAPREGARGGDGTLRERLGIPAEAKTVGFVGRMHWEKGPDVFLQAALLSVHRYPDTHFVLVGDGPMREKLTQTVDGFGLRDRIHFPGVCDDMRTVYHDFDIAVSSSYSEAMPLAVMEAMASGLPVIGTNVGGVPDLIEHERTGFLAEPGDAKAIADLLAYLLDAPDALREMGRCARERAVRRMNLDESVNRMAQVLQRLADGSGQRCVGSLLRERSV